MYKILKKSSMLLALTCCLFNCLAMNQPDFTKVDELPSIDSEKNDVRRIETVETLEYRYSCRALLSYMIISCTLYKTGKFAGQKSCYSVEKRAGGNAIDESWFNKLENKFNGTNN